MLVTNGGKQAVYEAFATLLDPGDEVLLPAPYWTTYPESIRLAGGVPVEVLTDEAHRLPGHRRAAGGGPHRAHQGAAVRLAVQPDRRGLLRPSRSRRSAAGPSSTACGWSPTRSTSTWSTATRGSPRCRRWCPSCADRCVVVNGVAKTYAMTGWRVGWMIGPTDVVKAATNLQSHATSNVANVAQVAALAAVAGDLSAVAEMRDGLRPAPADHRADAATRSPASTAPSREGAFYAYPSVKGAARQGDPRPAAGQPAPSWPS